MGNNDKKKQNPNSATPKTFDLTTQSTPMTDSDNESDSDVQIIESNANNSHFTQDSNTKTCTNNNNNNNNDDVLLNANHNFEKFTLLGIGGNLLRKAGWDGNRDSLYEKKGGPIQQSEKYKKLQRRNGLGYSHHSTKNKRFQPTLSSSTQSTHNRRIRLPRRRPMNMSSNTMDTAITLSDDDNDNDKTQKQRKRKRKRIEFEDDVVIVDKREVTKRRLNKIPFTTIIDKMQSETEQATKSFIESLFKGKKKKIAIMRMVISIKDSYSQ